jgi:hypothetical protein
MKILHPQTQQDVSTGAPLSPRDTFHDPQWMLKSQKVLNRAYTFVHIHTYDKVSLVN